MPSAAFLTSLSDSVMSQHIKGSEFHSPGEPWSEAFAVLVLQCVNQRIVPLFPFASCFSAPSRKSWHIFIVPPSHRIESM